MAMRLFTSPSVVTGPRGPSEGRRGPSAPSSHCGQVEPSALGFWLLRRRSDVRLRLSLVADRLENAVRAYGISAAGLLRRVACTLMFLFTLIVSTEADAVQIRWVHVPQHCEALSHWSDGRRSDAGGLFRSKETLPSGVVNI
ncbi:unnamed protein product [Symbiodinium sp. CCMP2592]|nr:unnamed protein product [Symbiodinium sp. CCMP2592]CAE7523853.1 unnamed protein product [Symbiodinium sp. CCMP2592]